MAIGPKASASYVETTLTTRSPLTPATPSGLDSNNTAFQTASPTPLAGDGLVCAGMFAIVLSVYAPEGQTLTSGTLRCVIWNPLQARWTWAPTFNVDISVAAGYPAYNNGSLQNISRLGILINWLADTVVMSGGPSLVVRIDGFTSTGPRGT